MCIPWLSCREFEAAVIPRSVPLPVQGLIELSAIVKIPETCMVNVRMDAKMPMMLVSI